VMIQLPHYCDLYKHVVLPPKADMIAGTSGILWAESSQKPHRCCRFAVMSALEEKTTFLRRGRLGAFWPVLDAGWAF
jgi:hypothetical protein